MKFRMYALNGSDILGGEVTEDNVNLSVYAQYQDKKPTDLVVGERCFGKASLCGTSTDFEVERTE